MAIKGRSFFSFCSRLVKLLAEAKNKKTSELTACVLNRPRHDSIIKSLKDLNVKIKFITDGDVSGAISVAYPDKEIDIYLGIGGAPEGVLAAAALKCLGCQMQARLHFSEKSEKVRAKKLGIKNLNKKYEIKDMIKGDVIFCATAVTDGDFLKGIKNHGDFYYSETLALHNESKTNTIFKNQSKK